MFMQKMTILILILLLGVVDEAWRAMVKLYNFMLCFHVIAVAHKF